MKNYQLAKTQTAAADGTGSDYHRLLWAVVTSDNCLLCFVSYPNALQFVNYPVHCGKKMMIVSAQTAVRAFPSAALTKSAERELLRERRGKQKMSARG